MKTNGTVVAGSLLLPATGQLCGSVTSTLATGEQAAEAIGKALTGVTGAGVVQALIRGW